VCRGGSWSTCAETERLAHSIARLSGRLPPPDPPRRGREAEGARLLRRRDGSGGADPPAQAGRPRGGHMRRHGRGGRGCEAPRVRIGVSGERSECRIRLLMPGTSVLAPGTSSASCGHCRSYGRAYTSWNISLVDAPRAVFMPMICLCSAMRVARRRLATNRSNRAESCRRDSARLSRETRRGELRANRAIAVGQLDVNARAAACARAPAAGHFFHRDGTVARPRSPAWLDRHGGGVTSKAVAA
jgi:hypothetical protein